MCEKTEGCCSTGGDCNDCGGVRCPLLLAACELCEDEVPAVELEDVWCVSPGAQPPQLQGWCPRCLERFTARCERCEMPTCADEVSAVQTLDGDARWCPRCIELAGVCDRCDRRTARSSLSPVETWAGHVEHWCAGCREDEVEPCARCGRDHFVDYGQHVRIGWYGDTAQWCDGCCDEESYCCERCGVRFSSTFDCGHVDDWGDCYCSNCFEEVEEENGPAQDGSWCDACGHGGNCGGVHGYTYKPEPRFHVSAAERSMIDALPRGWNWERLPELLGVPFVGLEVEVDCIDGGDVAAIAARVLDGRCYTKHDGSLDDGAEVVTHPHTLAALQEAPLADALRSLSRAGGRAWDTTTCGLHVHVGHAGLDRSQLGRLVALAYRCERELVKVSGRRPGELSQWATFERSHRSPLARVAKVAPGKAPHGERKPGRAGFGCGSADRYVAVNVTAATVEWRLFRGSLNPDTVMGCAQLAASAWHYVRTLDDRPRAAALSWAGWMAWLDGAGDAFAAARQLVRARGVWSGEVAV